MPETRPQKSVPVQNGVQKRSRDFMGVKKVLKWIVINGLDNMEHLNPKGPYINTMNTPD